MKTLSFCSRPRSATVREQDRGEREQREPRLLGELVLGDGREVEADQRDDRAGDDRRQQELDDAVAGAVDQQRRSARSTMPAATIPPSAAAIAAVGFAAVTGAMKAKLEPV